MVENQAVNTQRLAVHQAGKAFGKGLYLSSQESTAYYYADLQFATGRAGGPAIVRVQLPAKTFNEFAAARSIRIESPVPRPPTPGQTETFIPMQNLTEYNGLPGLRIFIHK